MDATAWKRWPQMRRRWVTEMACEKLQVEEKLMFQRFKDPLMCLLSRSTRGVDTSGEPWSLYVGVVVSVET